MTKKTMLLAAVSLCGAVFAGEVYKAEISDLVPAKSVKLEDGVFRAQSKRVWLYSKKVLTVDPAKKYTISGEFRFLGTAPKSFNLGFWPLTAKNRPISPECIHAVPETETTLAAAAAVGDTSLKITDAAKWENKRAYCAVVFDAKDDFADFPNYTSVVTKKGSVKKEGDVWEIELVKPLKKAYPAGTRIRQHLCGGTFIYPVMKYRKFSGEWEKFSGTVTGMTKSTRSDKAFWPCTAKVRVIVLTSGGADDSVLEFRNLTVEENE